MECDFCGDGMNYAGRRVAAVPRPSNSEELVAVMWGCGACESSINLPTVKEIWERFEAREYPGVIWVTI